MTDPQRTLADYFADPMLDQIPRLLTQVDRNPHSPTYGCCCRNHWHYRIEDIANGQMQEMALTFAIAWKFDRPNNPYYRSDLLLEWIEAILAYTLQIQRRSGCFDEVYRGQDSYAATAFVAFAVSETMLQLGRNLTGSLRNALNDMLYDAAAWLGRTGEDLAANQIAGAAAAFMNLAELEPGLGYEDGFDDLLERLGEMQTDEGWFPEYGGADIGYASLAHSFLALIAHRTRDKRARAMAAKASDFLGHFLHRDGTVGGVYGSRNTAYLIPLGAVLDAKRDPAAAPMLPWLAAHLDTGQHAVITDCLDDRYLAYLSPFYMLAAQAALSLPPGAAAPQAPVDRAELFEEAGLWSVEKPAVKIIANLRKGGVFHLDLGDMAYVDSGYFGEVPDGQIVTTQFLDPAAPIDVEGNRARITAELVMTKPVGINPWKNIAVRTFNLTMPAFVRRLFLDFLRNRAVGAGPSVGRVLREIIVGDDAVEVTDHINVNEPVLNLVLRLETERAFSFASTGFCELQEFATGDGSLPIDLAGGKVTLKRRYTLKEGMVVDE